MAPDSQDRASHSPVLFPSFLQGKDFWNPLSPPTVMELLMKLVFLLPWVLGPSPPAHPTPRAPSTEGLSGSQPLSLQFSRPGAALA